jgi:MFS transporter, PPP family, 3-phenylpropionic acid transporter
LIHAPTPEFLRRRAAVGIALVYVVYYHGAGLLIPFFPLWLRDHDLAPSDISIVLGLPLMVRTLVAPAFGSLGDAYGQRPLIRFMTALAIAMVLVLPFARSFWLILVLTLFLYVSWQSTPLQLDAVAVGMVRSKLLSSYGRIRGFGSLAFLAANLTGGIALSQFGTDGLLVYFALAAAALLVTTALLPKSDMSDQDAASGPGKSLWLQPKVLSVLLATALVQGAHPVFLSFGTLRMRDLGYSDTLIGVLLAAATLAEVAMFTIGSQFVKTVRPINLVRIGAGTAICRWLAVSFVVSPATFLVLQCSHAITFSVTALGLVAYLVRAVDPRQVARAQGLYISLFGASASLLTLAIGRVFDGSGGLAFLVLAAAPAAGLAVLTGREILLRLRASQ